MCTELLFSFDETYLKGEPLFILVILLLFFGHLSSSIEVTIFLGTVVVVVVVLVQIRTVG